MNSKIYFFGGLRMTKKCIVIQVEEGKAKIQMEDQLIKTAVVCKHVIQDIKRGDYAIAVGDTINELTIVGVL